MYNMKKKAVLEKNIEELKLSNKIITLLKDNEISLVEDLWKLKRKELKELGLSDNEISQITIQLQLYGIDLNKKIY